MTTLLLCLWLISIGFFLGWSWRDYRASADDTRRWDMGCRCEYQADAEDQT